MSTQVTLSDARRIIAAAEKKAAEIGQPMNIAVADEGGNLVSHVRMDGAWIGSIDISQKKAYTSRAFDISTKDLAPHSQSGGQFFGIHASNDGQNHDFRGRHSAEEGWQGSGRDRRQRRIRRSGSCSGGSRRCRVLDLTYKLNVEEKRKTEWQAIEVWHTWARGRSRYRASTFPNWPSEIANANMA